MHVLFISPPYPPPKKKKNLKKKKVMDNRLKGRETITNVSGKKGRQLGKIGRIEKIWQSLEAEYIIERS